MAKGDPLLEVEHLVKHFPIKSGILFDREVASVKAVDDVSLTLHEGETLGLVGESGCGKSTLCRTIIQLLEPTSGSVRYRGKELVGVSRNDLRPVRREIQMIFQDPYASLNPRKRVGQIIGDPIQLHGLAAGTQLRREVQQLMERVGPAARALQPLSARVLGRPAAADRDRPRARAPAEADHRRRARLRARRLDPGADHQPARGPPGRVRPLLHLRRARSRRRAPCLRPDRRHVPRQDRGALAGGGRSTSGRSTPTRWRCSPPCRSPIRRRTPSASRWCWRGTCPAPWTRPRHAGSIPAARGLRRSAHRMSRPWRTMARRRRPPVITPATSTRSRSKATEVAPDSPESASDRLPDRPEPVTAATR